MLYLQSPNVLASEICLVTAQRLKTTIANTKAANKLIEIFKNGITIPSPDVEVSLDNNSTNAVLSIVCYSDENKDYLKHFVIPQNTNVSKLIFYIAPDQELHCILIGVNFENEAVEIFNTSPKTIVKIK